MKNFQAHAIALALAAAFPSLAAAQSNDELMKELRALKDRVTQLESALKAKDAAKAAEPDRQWGMTPEQAQELNRVTVKTEALEDAMEAQGFKSLKISGMLDPTYVYNYRQGTASFAFQNPFAGPEVFAYDNSYSGLAMIDFQKELDGGTRWRLTLATNKSVGSNYNYPSLVHEASVSIPLGDLQTRAWAGQIPDWSGYEYYFANQTKLITHNLMFDFLAPTFYTGVGTDMTIDKWQIKTALANMNSARNIVGEDGYALRSPVVSARVDYAKGEFSGFGGSVQFGRTTNNVAGGYSGLANGEVDGYFIRGDITLQGQLNYGQQTNAAFNGGDSRWYGLSTLGAYKLSPRFELVGRADYIDNSRNGGGTFNIAFPTCGEGLCPDGRNGFGPGMVQDADTGLWAVGDPNKGVNRYALSFGVNYALTTNVVLKAEYRFDGANQAVFIDPRTGNYFKTNQVFGASVVASF